AHPQTRSACVAVFHISMNGRSSDFQTYSGGRKHWEGNTNVANDNGKTLGNLVTLQGRIDQVDPLHFNAKVVGRRCETLNGTDQGGGRGDGLDGGGAHGESGNNGAEELHFDCW